MREGVLTTTQAAKLAGVSETIIRQSCDRGELEHYYVPGSSHRRISREAFHAYILENGLSTEAFIQRTPAIALFDCDAVLAGVFQSQFNVLYRRVVHASDVFTAGMVVQESAVDAAVCDASFLSGAQENFLRKLRAALPNRSPIIGTYSDDSISNQHVFSDTFQKPYNPILLLRRIDAIRRSKQRK